MNDDKIGLPDDNALFGCFSVSLRKLFFEI